MQTTTLVHLQTEIGVLCGLPFRDTSINPRAGEPIFMCTFSLNM